MEHRMRDFLEKALRRFGSHFNSAPVQGLPNPQPRLVEDESIPQDPFKNQTALTPLSLSNSPTSERYQRQLQEQPNAQPPLQLALDTQLTGFGPASHLAVDTALSQTGRTEDHIKTGHGSAFAYAEDASCPSLPLTEDIVAQIIEVLKTVRELENMESSCQSAREKADVGRTFMRHAAEAQTEDEGPRRDWYIEELKDRESAIHADIQRQDTLEESLQSRKHELDHSRKRLERTLENVLIDKQLYNVTDVEESAKIPEAMDVDTSRSVISVNGRTWAEPPAEGSLVDPYRPVYSDVSPVTSEDRRLFGIPSVTDVKERYEAAVSNLQLLQGYFDAKEQDSEEEIQRYREAFRNGEVDFPESDVRELHVQQARELTQNLIGAEIEYQEALEDYRGCGFQTEDDMSTMSCYEDYEEPYSSEPGELAATTAMQDHSRVAMWVEQVAESQQDDVAQPDIDPWGDDKSVSISSTFSMVEKDQSRRNQIDRWQFYCSTFRTPE